MLGIPRNRNSPTIAAVRTLLAVHVAKAGDFHQTVTLLVAGGTAAHYWAAQRFTRDLDVEFHGKARFPCVDLQVAYQDASGHEKTIYIDWSYNSTLGPLHETYVERAVEAPEMSPDPRVRVFVMAPVDLVISKLQRFSASDQEDIAALMPLVDRAQLRSLALEAFDVYVGSKDFLHHNLRDALNLAPSNAPSMAPNTPTIASAQALHSEGEWTSPSPKGP